MLLRFLVPFLFALSLAVLAQAERRLPADLQVDLLFPRNETYAPKQWFPIVLGIQNLDALWPFDISLDPDVLSLNAWQNTSSGARAEWQHVDFRLNSVNLPKAVGPAPGKHFLYYSTINMTNGTTDRFAVRRGITLENRCFANNSVDDGGDFGQNGLRGGHLAEHHGSVYARGERDSLVDRPAEGFGFLGDGLGSGACRVLPCVLDSVGQPVAELGRWH